MDKLRQVRNIAAGSVIPYAPRMSGALGKQGECCVGVEDVFIFWKVDGHVLGPKSMIGMQTLVCCEVCPTFWHPNMTSSSMAMTLKDIHY